MITMSRLPAHFPKRWAKSSCMKFITVKSSSIFVYFGLFGFCRTRLSRNVWLWSRTTFWFRPTANVICTELLRRDLIAPPTSSVSLHCHTFLFNIRSSSSCNIYDRLKLSKIHTSIPSIISSLLIPGVNSRLSAYSHVIILCFHRFTSLN